jgi:hypothetical protein
VDVDIIDLQHTMSSNIYIKYIQYILYIKGMEMQLIKTLSASAYADRGCGQLLSVCLHFLLFADMHY